MNQILHSRSLEENNKILAKIMTSHQFKVRCRLCQTSLESKHTGDYQKCSCGKVAIDGGKSKNRRRLMGLLDHVDPVD